MPVALSVVIPAFNEGAQLGETIERVRQHCQQHHARHEVIIVDDGSLDRTAAVVERAAATWPELRLLRHPRNRGKGAALRTGVLAASHDWVLCTDADLSIPIAEVLRFLEQGAGHDLVIASRSLPGARTSNAQVLHRKLMGRVFNGLVRLLGVGEHQDTQCGFKLYRRPVARDLFGQAQIDGFAFDVEILYLAHRAGYAVLELPVTWHDNKRTTVRLAIDPLHMLLDLVRLRARHLLR